MLARFKDFTCDVAFPCDVADEIAIGAARKSWIESFRGSRCWDDRGIDTFGMTLPDMPPSRLSRGEA